MDKIRFLRRLEEESHAFLIRPRRFGKSLWVSVLENCYDCTRASALVVENEFLLVRSRLGRGW